jgi:hypothetical protein
VTVASGVVLAIGLAWRVAVIGRRRPRTAAGDRSVDRPRAIAN